MTKSYCDGCGREIVHGLDNCINIIDIYTVVKLGEPKVTWCELCGECQRKMREEVKSVLEAYLPKEEL